MEEHRIQVQPSGHEFHAVAEETLLEAALRSGLNVNFHCSSGSCGDCKARLVQGALGEEEFHDYRLSALEQSQGFFLLCTAHADGDLVIETAEASSTKDIPRQQLIARVSKVEVVGERLRILQLRTPRTSPLRFLAGQHVALTLPGIGSYDSSIASCPCNGAQLQFHIPFEAGNPFVERLFAGLRHGSEVAVDGPFGEMTLDDDSPRPLLFIAQDHELAPMKSLIEHAINLDVAQAVRLIWIAEEAGHYMENYCRSWAEALDDYRFTPLSYRTGETSEVQVKQVLASVTEQIPQLDGWDVYWAGDRAFSLALQSGLLALGADATHLFFPRRRVSRLPLNTALS